MSVEEAGYLYAYIQSNTLGSQRGRASHHFPLLYFGRRIALRGLSEHFFCFTNAFIFSKVSSSSRNAGLGRGLCKAIPRVFLQVFPKLKTVDEDLVQNCARGGMGPYAPIFPGIVVVCVECLFQGMMCPVWTSLPITH